jgi:hypothetical protein
MNFSEMEIKLQLHMVISNWMGCFLVDDICPKEM